MSEANLLNSDCYSEVQDRVYGRPRGGYDNFAMDMGRKSNQSRTRKSRENLLQHQGGQSGLRSRAASQMSVASRQSKLMKNGEVSYR